MEQENIRSDKNDDIVKKSRRGHFVKAVAAGLTACLGAFVLTPLMGTEVLAEESNTFGGTETAPYTNWADLKKAIEEDGKTGDIYISGDKIVADSPIEITSGTVNIKSAGTANVFRQKSDNYDTLFKVSGDGTEFKLEGVTLSGKTVDCGTAPSDKLDDYAEVGDQEEPQLVTTVVKQNEIKENERYALKVSGGSAYDGYFVGADYLIDNGNGNTSVRYGNNFDNEHWIISEEPGDGGQYDWHIFFDGEGPGFRISPYSLDGSDSKTGYVLRSWNGEGHKVTLDSRGRGASYYNDVFFITNSEDDNPEALAGYYNQGNDGNLWIHEGSLVNDRDRQGAVGTRDNSITLVTYEWKLSDGSTYKTKAEAEENAKSQTKWIIPVIRLKNGWMDMRIRDVIQRLLSALMRQLIQATHSPALPTTRKASSFRLRTELHLPLKKAQSLPTLSQTKP